MQEDEGGKDEALKFPWPDLCAGFSVPEMRSKLTPKLIHLRNSGTENGWVFFSMRRTALIDVNLCVMSSSCRSGPGYIRGWTSGLGFPCLPCTCHSMEAIWRENCAVGGCLVLWREVCRFWHLCNRVNQVLNFLHCFGPIA